MCVHKLCLSAGKSDINYIKMASSKPVQSGMQRLIECSVCLEIYQIPSKLPKNLQCGHTFCSECLKKLLASGRIKCSKCRRLTLVPDAEVEKLVTNFNTLDVLETSCEECRDQQWVTRCNHCSKNVCETCHAEHTEQDQVELKDRLEEAKKRVQQMAEKYAEDTYLQDLDDKRETAEEEVTEHWDDIIRRAEEGKKQDSLKIRQHHERACEEYMKWKENFQMSVVKTKSALEKYLSRFGRKYTSPTTSEEATEINQNMEKLVKDLESDVTKKPAMAGYQIDLTSATLQSIIETGVVKLVSEELAVSQSVTGYPTKSQVLLPQYNQTTHSLTYGHEGSGPGQFGWPLGVASCPTTGNIVISDTLNHRVHILTSSLQPVSVSGYEGSGDGQYQYPFGVAISPNTSHMFVADQCNHRIQVLDCQGRPLYRFGYEGSDPNQFDCPKGIAIDQSDLVYICDSKNYRVRVTQSDGSLVITFGSQGSGPGQFSSVPQFIVVSQDNKLVISDWDGHLYIFTCAGQHIRTIKAGQPGSFVRAKGVTMDTNSNIIVADDEGCLFVLKYDGQVVSKIGSPGSGAGQLDTPRGVTLTAEGDIVVADRNNHIIQLYKVPKA